MGLEFVLLHAIQGSLSVSLFVRGRENEVFGRPCFYPGNVAGGTLPFLVWSTCHIVQCNM